jgi:hypothetical protein
MQNKYNVIKGGEEKAMPHWNEPKWIIGRGRMWAAWGGACWIFGIIFAIIGIISAVINTNFISLTPDHWFFLSIAAFAASIPEYIGWAVAVYLDYKEAKK